MTIKLDIGKSRFATPVRTGQHRPNFRCKIILTAIIICDSESVRFHLFVCLSVFSPFVSHHKTRLISAKGRRPNGPKEPGRENKETDCRRAIKKKIKKREKLNKKMRKEKRPRTETNG
jgi:hypothetical protein